MTNVPLSERVVQFGLTEVWSPPEALVDIVLVHGLNGHPYNTWSTHNPEVFWPTDLLPPAIEDQRCRILTYGYDAQVTAFTDGASKDKIHNHAEHLASRLVANRSLKKALERPIIFVCHSLGGLVVKRCLIHSKNVRHAHIERQRSIFVSTYGILFLGTPHNGSDVAKWGSLLERISHAVLPKKVMDSQPQLVQALKTDNETLLNINRLFIEIIGRFRIYFFHESKPMDFKGTRMLVVEEGSAAPVIEGVERMGIERDHSHMCKFETDTAPGYEVVAEALQRYAQDAPSLISTRWEEERRIRELERRRKQPANYSATVHPASLLAPQSQSARFSQANSMDNSMGAAPPPKTLRQRSPSPYEVEEVEDDEVAVPGLSSISDIRDNDRPTSASPERPIDGPRLVTPLGHRPNAHFVGFQDEMRRLYKRLQQDGRRDTGTRSVLVWGEVGSGKTHLTRQFFYKHRQDYPEGSFWVDCKTTETITKGLWDIGISIGALERERDRRTVPPGPDNFADAVRQSLEALHGWLLVFDGVLFESEESLDAFRKYIPDQSGNCIIFTSVDRTLSHRHRLLDPSPLKVGKLTVGDAVDLLYRNLGIRQPNKVQAQKALDLVKDYDYLPLGIHAAAHALIEHGKALERYTHISTDLRLITPFLDIVSALRNQGRDEAVNLVNLLSFFNHQLPVALVRFGLKGLTESPYEVDILSPKYANSSRTDLDSSISILMRSGLLERTLQTWSRSSGSSSPEDSRSIQRGPTAQHARANGQRAIIIRTLENTPPSQIVEESSGLDDMVLTRFESRGTRTSGASSQSVIDTLRIHTVVQNVIRDDLKEKPLVGEHDYWWWLGAAVRMLTHSYSVACDKMRKSTGAGLVRDYREYEAQAARLFSLFPKTSLNATMELRDARHDVRALLHMVKREIQNRSPSQASENSSRRLYQESVFERSSVTSEEAESPTLSSPSRTSTWSYEPERPPSESPTQMHRQPRGSIEIDTTAGIISEVDTDAEATIMSDDGSWSNTTETPNHALLPRSRRSSVLHAVLEGKPNIRRHKDLGEWKALPAPPSISHPDILTHSSRTSSETRSSRPSSSSEAEAALAAMHRSSPPASRGTGRLRSTSRGSVDRPILGPKSANASLSPLISDSQLSGASKNSLVKSQQRNPSLSPQLKQALLNSQASTRPRQELPPLLVENISVAYSVGRTERPPLSYSHPRTLVESPVPVVNYLPSGYTSMPMSRDTSRESDNIPHVNVSDARNLAGSAPQRTFSDPYTLGVDAPGTYGFNLQDPGLYVGDHHSRGMQNDLGNLGEWTDFTPTGPAQGSFVSLPAEEERRGVQGRHSEALQFGGMEPVSIDEARARADMARARSADSSTRGRSRGGQSNNHSERGH